MARTIYYVVTNQGQWMVKLNDIHYGPYQTQSLAIKAAVDAAHSTGSKGGNAQVLVQGADSKWRTEWTYGNDPYPPRG
ncbi:hypothetical protein GCM10028808_62580 [Spirosoma migulaei]